MELRHLRYFVTVADEENISRAAARLHISQPAISRQIKDLEEDLGVPLFHRHQEGMQLTPAGSAFLAHARDLLRRVNVAVVELDQFRSHVRQRITIGAITPVLTGTLTPALRRFHQKYPHIEVRIMEKSSTDQVKALRDHKLDAAFIGQACDELGREFKLVPLQRHALQVVVADDHLFALRKRLRLMELAEEPFVVLDDEEYPARTETICKICQDAGFTPKFREHPKSVAALFALVAAGKGVALIPSEAGLMPHPQTRLIPLAKPAPEVVSSALVPTDRESVALRYLLECCTASEND